MLKKVMLVLTALSIFLALPKTVFASDFNNEVPINAKAAIVSDATTGQILYSKNANQALPAASMSKLLTAYIVLNSISKGKISWNQKIRPDEVSIKVSQDNKLSNVPLKENQEYTVKALYQAMLIYSANGATMALAHEIAGSHIKFTDMMRKQAKNLGIFDAKIYTSNGLPNGEVFDAKYPNANDRAENKFSARDMAILCERILKDYPEILQTTSIPKMKFENGTNETQMDNWNWMLKGLSKSNPNLPVDGLKTGTSDLAGACFAATVNKDNHRLITIVMGAPHNNDTDTTRFEETQRLMEYAYNNYDYQEIKSGENLNRLSVPIYHGKKSSVLVKATRDSHIWLEKVKANKIEARVVLDDKLTEKNKVKAPIERNQVIGNYEVKASKQKLDFLNKEHVLLLKASSSKSVSKANILEILLHSF